VGRSTGRVRDPAGSPNAAGQGGDTRISRKRTQRIERLERTAARIFAEKGYDAANFDVIAAELDLRGSSLYYYFPSKEDLFLRCITKSADEVFARLRKIAETDVAPADKLRALFREQVLIEVRDYPEFVPLFFRTRIADPDLMGQVLRIRREHAAIFEKIAEELRSASGAEADEVRVWLSTAFGALAYLPEWYDPSGRMTVDRLAEILAATLIEPFLRSAGTSTPAS
jgi:AcrR family transcriptional regulator